MNERVELPIKKFKAKSEYYGPQKGGKMEGYGVIMTSYSKIQKEIKLGFFENGHFIKGHKLTLMHGVRWIREGTFNEKGDLLDGTTTKVDKS